MKKTIKQLALIAIMLLLVFSLAGCGSKLVATKTEETENGKVNYKYVIEFKKDELKNIEMTTEYEDKEKADEAMGIFEMMNSFAEKDEDKINVKQDGKKLIIVLDAKQFENLSDAENSSKDAIKKSLEEEGFKVK